MKDTSKILSIIAYYFSEYNAAAVNALGYKNATQAFKAISVMMDRNNNYLKLRRDEFDALPTSSSHRKGWRNRPAAPDVVKLANDLSIFNFNELTEIVENLISQNNITESSIPISEVDYSNISEIELENIINAIDSNATYRIKTSSGKSRVYKTSIIDQLKKLYSWKCQICGANIFEDYGISVCEGHHIDYFSTSLNNNVNNIVILCPNHHRLIHKLDPEFNRETLEFNFSNGSKLKLALNLHL